MDYDKLIAEIMGGVQEQYIEELSDKFIELLEEGCTNPDRYAVLAQLAPERAMGIYAEYKDKLPKNVQNAFRRALKVEDERILKSLNHALGKRPYLSEYAQRVADEAAIGLTEIIQRDNIALADEMARTWIDVTGEAVLRHQSGESLDSVMEQGVRDLARAGLITIDYVSGRKTSIDAALKRHIVSQANQAKNRLLLQRMEEWEHDLVFVSAHFGARPEHAEWQGKVFSVSGSSEKYPSLVEGTGYGTVTGLCGVNCRHDMTPYVEGYSQLPNTDFSEEEEYYGMTSNEYYEAEQKQRVYERRIRETKRQIVELDRSGIDTTKERIKLGKQQGALRNYTAKNNLRRQYGRERAYAIGKQPRALWGVTERGRRIKDRSLPGGVNSLTKVNREVIESRAYRRKFKQLDYPEEVISLCYKACKSVCHVASGSEHEALVLISISDMKVLGRSLNREIPLQTVYTKKLNEAIASHAPGDIIAIHNHPNSTPPTGSDFFSAFSHGYKAGIVACHNGDVWYFEPGDVRINSAIFDSRYSRYLDTGLTHEQAIKKCVEHFSHMSGGLKCVKL